MRERTLVILAAGMGSRFGGMKQVEPVGPNGEFIIDYSIYSAKRYGFNKVVFIIKEEFLDLFKSTIGARLEGQIDVEYAFQKTDIVPEGFIVPEGRVKPLGTAQAIYCVKDHVSDNFAVITADDFYGDEAFKNLGEFLDTCVGENKDRMHGIIGYNVGDTLSENGAVKRGVIIHEDGVVKQITESSCTLEGDVVRCVPLDKEKEEFNVLKTQPVSMLMNAIGMEMFDRIKTNMLRAQEKGIEDPMSYEALLPDVIDDCIKDGSLVRVVPTNSIWMGMTYKEDAELVKNFIASEIEKGVYPENLWGEKTKTL